MALLTVKVHQSKGLSHPTWEIHLAVVDDRWFLLHGHWFGPLNPSGSMRETR